MQHLFFASFMSGARSCTRVAQPAAALSHSPPPKPRICARAAAAAAAADDDDVEEDDEDENDDDEEEDECREDEQITLATKIRDLLASLEAGGVEVHRDDEDDAYEEVN